ncbi:MAG: pantetheine-phosphate adenylyltransferase [Defluviitaleaceae bacterium]|nr:pantetheine-phosphate adenylyltransferase [Defluviitaleaceae bacterium]
MVIGITGGSGSGKSTIAQGLGYKIIDVDSVYHGLLETSEELRYALVQSFGTFDRKVLAGIVFTNLVELEKLNHICARFIIPAVKERLAEFNENVVIDAAVLFELGLEMYCDITVAVVATQEERLLRIVGRDGLRLDSAQARINAQKPDTFYIRKADFVVYNNSLIMDAVKAIKNRLLIGNRKAVYGGTFDPPTLGHLDVIKRAALLYEKLHVVVLVNEMKKPVFSVAERVEMLRAITDDVPNIDVDCFDGLLAKYAQNKRARYSVRGVRNGFDAEYERPMFEFNAQIAREEYGFALDTIFIPTTRDHADTSSGNVCRLLSGGAYKVAEKYLDPRIAERVIARFRQ